MSLNKEIEEIIRKSGTIGTWYPKGRGPSAIELMKERFPVLTIKSCEALVYQYLKYERNRGDLSWD